MSSIYDWSLTEANNDSSDSIINWRENQLPNTVNNSARAMMKRVAEFVKDISGPLTAGSTANALTLTDNSAFTTLTDGLIVTFKAAASNTDAATINVNARGAKAIRKIGPSGDVALTAGDIVVGGRYVLIYSTSANGAASGWLLTNPLGVIPDNRLPNRLKPSTISAPITDWNDATESGWYMGDGAANAPPTSVVTTDRVVCGHVVAYTSEWIVQSAWGTTASPIEANTRLAMRVCSSGVWSDWFKLQRSHASADARYQPILGYTPANASVTFTAGTGLTGGGTLATNRTFNVTYGTTAGTAAQGNADNDYFEVMSQPRKMPRRRPAKAQPALPADRLPITHGPSNFRLEIFPGATRYPQ